MDEKEVEVQELMEKRFGEQINFMELFRVKEKKGLFCLGSKVHKSGMVRMVRFLTPTEAVTVNEDKLICLGHLFFQTELGFKTVIGAGKIGMNDVFSNLFEFYETEEYNKNPEMTPGLEVFVPNYDKNLFKERHAVQVLGWFDEVVTKMMELNGVKEDIKGENTEK